MTTPTQKLLMLLKAPVGFMSNGGAQNYAVNITSSSGYFAVKNATGAVTIYPSGAATIPGSHSISFWGCAGVADASYGAAQITAVVAQNTGLTSLDVSRLSALGQLRVDRNALTSLDVRGLGNLMLLTANNIPGLTTIYLSGTGLLSSVDISYSGVSALELSGCNSLASFNVRLSNPLTYDVNLLNALYTALPNFSTGTHTINVGISPPSAKNASTPSIATAKRWSVTS